MAEEAQPILEDKQIVAEQPPEGAGSDEVARLEAAAIAQAKLNEHTRDDRMHGHLHNATVCVVWAFVIAFSIMGAVWLWHMVAPEKWAFLTATQFDKLNTSLLAALGSSVVTERARKLLR